MKGNASTSLMKTLISKKPSNGLQTGSNLLISSSSTKSANTPASPVGQAQFDTVFNISPANNSTTALASNSSSSSSSTPKNSSHKTVKHLTGSNASSKTSSSLDELNINVHQQQTSSSASPSSSSSSSSSQQPNMALTTTSNSSSPIGTKFALTMLGLTTNTNKLDPNLFQRRLVDKKEDGSGGSITACAISPSLLKNDPSICFSQLSKNSKSFVSLNLFLPKIINNLRLV